MLTRDLEYDLPSHLIATTPAQPRDSARLMVVRRAENRIEHRQVRELGDASADLLRAGDLIIFNQSRVLPAHFEAKRASTGGHISGLYVRSQTGDDRHWEVMLESGGKLRAGEMIRFAGDAQLELLEKQDGGLWTARLHGEEPTIALLTRIGTVPLPPYIVAQRKKQEQTGITPGDLERYNTIYARDPGSVAAPTAGLHFTPELFAKLSDMGVQQGFVTLHVGLGTFASIRTERVEEHAMHSEWISIPAQTIALIQATRAAGHRIVPVGTTSVRALESLPCEISETVRTQGYEGETSLLIYPRDQVNDQASDAATESPFRFTDAMMTNFHLPHSTLLALVAALPDVGIDKLKAWYRIAIEQRYRFYSYGDAMLLI